MWICLKRCQIQFRDGHKEFLEGESISDDKVDEIHLPSLVVLTRNQNIAYVGKYPSSSVSTLGSGGGFSKKGTSR
jgi:hypothetical protein